MDDKHVENLMKAFAMDAVSIGARRGVKLDYSEQSLFRIDELLGHESFIGRTPRTPENPEDEETLWVLSKCFGAYIGEVVCRVMGGRWLSQPTSDGGLRPVIEVYGIKGFPVEKVWKRLTKSEFDALGGYCQFLRYIHKNQAKGK